MADFAIVLGAEGSSPRPVRLADAGDVLELSTRDSVENVPWWRLYRVGDEGTTHRFRRLDRRNWELRVTAGGDRALLAHVGRRPFHKLIHPLRRLQVLKLAGVSLVVLYTLAQHAPPEWFARSIPSWAQHRLVEGMIAQQAPSRCAHAGGEAAVRKILVRLDPDLGSKVDIVAIKNGGFVVTSTPDDKIYMLRSSMNEIEPAALPALLAHELSHLRHGDAIVATVRQNGYLGTWAKILDGSTDSLEMNFSGLEERRADLEAMQMMRRAGIPLQPAAEMFEQMRLSKAEGSYFGFDQRDFHFGIDSRAQRWAAAAANDPRQPVPILTDAETDDLYNFCWAGPLKPLHPERAPADAAPAGRGGVMTRPIDDKHP